MRSQTHANYQLITIKNSLLEGLLLRVTLGRLAAGRHLGSAGQLDRHRVKGLLEHFINLSNNVIDETIVLDQVCGWDFLALEGTCQGVAGKRKHQINQSTLEEEMGKYI
jgi:hypothetical protein